MKTKKAVFLTGVILTITINSFGQSQLTPSPNTPTTPTITPTYTTNPNEPYTNPQPGSNGPYTTPPVKQQTVVPTQPTPPPITPSNPIFNPAPTPTVFPNPAPTPGSPTITQPPMPKIKQ